MDKALKQNTKLVPMLQGVFLAYLITAFIILILSFLMLKLDLPSAVISGGINLSYIVSTLVGGFFVGKRLEQRKFLWGLMMGIIYFVILMLLCIFLNQANALPMGSLLVVLLMCGFSGMIGGMIS